MTPRDPLTPPPDARHVVVVDGDAFIWPACPTVVVVRAQGCITLEIAQGMTEVILDVIERDHQVTACCDFAAVTRYTREAREWVTEFVLAHRPAILATHVLIASKFVALGISAFKYATGDKYVHSYANRASFLESYEKATARLSSARQR